MKSIKIDLKDWHILISRHLGDFAKMCATHFCETNNADSELYLQNVEANMKRLKKFVEHMKTPKGSYTFKGYEDIDFLFCFVQYIIRYDTQARQSVKFLDIAIEISSLMGVEAKEANETEFYDDTINFRDYLCRVKIENNKG